jgi:hypothetical protein
MRELPIWRCRLIKTRSPPPIDKLPQREANGTKKRGTAARWRLKEAPGSLCPPTRAQLVKITAWR